MSGYDPAELRLMLERTGGAIHTVDDAELFCRVKGCTVEPDGLGRVMVERLELSHIAGDTFERRAYHDTQVDGITWAIVGVRRKLSGMVIWTMEREIG